MTRRDWWLGVTLIVLALLLHALVPRYEWWFHAGTRITPVRLDRWTGQAEVRWLPDPDAAPPAR